MVLNTSPAPRPRRRTSSYVGANQGVTAFGTAHWLFRANVARKRNSVFSVDVRKRNFFGMGGVLGVLANPAETVRSLTEGKRLLEEARQEIAESRERAQLRPKHTFSRLPGFFPRKAEARAIERALEGEPSFTVLFGASSVGKTAVLREVLNRDSFHVLHFDLRIAGFADLTSLYMSFSEQMEQYWEHIASTMPGYEEFEKEAWGFKYDRLNVEKRLELGDTPSRISQVRTSDVARLFELFQSSLLKYWEFEPFRDESDPASPHVQDGSSPACSDRTRVENSAPAPRSRWGWRGLGRGKGKREHKAKMEEREREREREREKGKQRSKPQKKMPVLFFDEAHRLPALIRSTETMKVILDSMLVLTKQDRLCHVIHATSDPFYQTWLRQLNVMQHCKVITISDCSRAETRRFFVERILPRVPERLHGGLHFDSLYDAFGGKLAHWQDYVIDYVNSGGHLDIKQSSHFLQAHALLNLHIIHSSQSGQHETDSSPRRDTNSSTDGIHPGLGRAGLKTYSPIAHPHAPDEADRATANDRANTLVAGYYAADFSAMQLLKVMSRLAQPDVRELPYFLLCREMGVRAVDGMVKGRILDLRWTDPVTRETDELPRPRSGVGAGAGAGTGIVEHDPGSSGTAVEGAPSEEGDMVALDEADAALAHMEGEDGPEIVGPKLVPTTPIMRYAMVEVVQEYEDVDAPSEYASLSDVDEY